MNSLYKKIVKYICFPSKKKNFVIKLYYNFKMYKSFIITAWLFVQCNFIYALVILLRSLLLDEH